MPQMANLFSNARAGQAKYLAQLLCRGLSTQVEGGGELPVSTGRPLQLGECLTKRDPSLRR